MIMSDEESKRVIAEIRRMTRGVVGSMVYDYYHDPVAVSEVVCAALIAVGYDPDWVRGPFGDALEADVRDAAESLSELGGDLLIL